MPIDDIYRAKIASYQHGQVALNVTHWIVTAVQGLEATQQEICNAIDLAVHGQYKALMVTTSTYHGVQVQKIRPALSPLVSSTSTNTGPGTAVAPSLPDQVCGMLTLRTSFAGRKFRGRVYVPFPAAGNNDPATGTPVVGYLPLLTNLGNKFIAAVTAGAGGNTTTLRCGIYSRATNAINLVQTTVSRQKWATQRRRGNYGRPNLIPPW